jgi:hypothetical protein
MAVLAAAAATLERLDCLVVAAAAAGLPRLCVRSARGLR